MVIMNAYFRGVIDEGKFYYCKLFKYLVLYKLILELRSDRERGRERERNIK